MRLRACTGFCAIPRAAAGTLAVRYGLSDTAPPHIVVQWPWPPVGDPEAEAVKRVACMTIVRVAGEKANSTSVHFSL